MLLLYVCIRYLWVYENDFTVKKKSDSVNSVNSVCSYTQGGEQDKQVGVATTAVHIIPTGSGRFVSR